MEVAEQDLLDAKEIAPFLWVRKSRSESWTYRRGHTDRVLVTHYDNHGNATGLVVIDGVFSFQAIQEPSSNVPILSRALEQIFAELQATRGSHRYRAVRNAFNSLPLDYLFFLPPEDIRSVIQQILDTDADQQIHLHLTCDPDQSFAFVFVALPRADYSEELRVRTQRYLHEKFSAAAVNDGAYAGDASSVTMHYFLTGARPLPPSAINEIQTDIEQMASSWSDRLREELVGLLGDREGNKLFHHYEHAFPESYKENTSVARAASDIRILESLDSGNPFDCEVYAEEADARSNIVRIRFYETKNVLLTDLLPVLDNLGLIVHDQFTSPIQAQEPRGPVCRYVSNWWCSRQTYQPTTPP